MQDWNIEVVPLNDHLSPEFQLSEFKLVLVLDVDRLYATHCTLDRVKAGGYDKRFIESMAGYMAAMVAEVNSPGYDSKPAQAYIAQALDNEELTWWPAYEQVHQWNREAVRQAVAK